MKFKFPYHPLFLALLSALLFTLSWQPFGLFFLAFAGFVPMFFLAEKFKDNAGKFFLYTFLSMLIRYIGNTWWIWNASAGGAAAAFLVNALLMCLPFMLMHRMQKYNTQKQSLWFFIYAWLAFEYLHTNWEIAYPWLSLGNVFSSVPEVVQWYEYTGVFGGGLWILIVNRQLFLYLKKVNERSRVMNFSKGFNLAFFLLFVPIYFSFYVKSNYKQSGKPLEVLVVQPNIDPYTEKFEGMSPEEQTIKMLQIAEDKMDSTTSLICFPETALLGGLDEEQFNYNPVIKRVRNFLQKHPHVQILSGADTYRFFVVDDKKSATARRYSDNYFYDSYNTALFFNQSDTIGIYHKSKLVPAVEAMPYPKIFSVLEKLSINMGGTSGSLGRDTIARVFDLGRGNKIAPVICFESVFGEYVSEYVKNGAGLICIVTNDGWWDNTPGYRQHFDYARLRAIETRRYIARSANTGISGFIDDKGQVMSQTNWWVEDAQKATVYFLSEKTFYTEHGDYIGWIAALLFGINFLQLLARRKTTPNYTA